LTNGRSCQDLYHELTAYTLSHAGQEFVHQYVVDAYAAQHAAENPKPITTFFALIGLYLFVERHYSGREIQKAHMGLGQSKRDWPVFTPPMQKALLTVADPLHVPEGDERDDTIRAWARAVWAAWKREHPRIAEQIAMYLPE
jgi:hypothetical protein